MHQRRRSGFCVAAGISIDGGASALDGVRDGNLRPREAATLFSFLGLALVAAGLVDLAFLTGGLLVLLDEAGGTRCVEVRLYSSPLSSSPEASILPKRRRCGISYLRMSNDTIIGSSPCPGYGCKSFASLQESLDEEGNGRPNLSRFHRRHSCEKPTSSQSLAWCCW